MGKVSIIATIKVKDGRGDDIIAAFAKGAELLHTEPGTEQYVLHRNQNDPNTFYVTGSTPTRPRSTPTWRARSWPRSAAGSATPSRASTSSSPTPSSAATETVFGRSCTPGGARSPKQR